MMVVENIGEVLVRGHSGYGERVYGNITHLASPDIIKPYMVRGRLLVIPNYDDAFAPFVRESIGVILHNHISDNASEEKLLSFAKEAQKPILVRADDARRILKEGQLVTLDPSKALVYKGVVMEKGEKKKAKKDTSSKKLGKTVI
jgi:pyruvate kinase